MVDGLLCIHFSRDIGQWNPRSMFISKCYMQPSKKPTPRQAPLVARWLNISSLAHLHTVTNTSRIGLGNIDSSHCSSTHIPDSIQLPVSFDDKENFVT